MNNSNNNSNEAVKARVTKRIQRFMIMFMVPSMLVLLGYLIWANSFMVIVPPAKYDSVPNGAILWSYWENRDDQIISPDFIQEIDLKTLIVMTYIKAKNDRKPLRLPYIRRLHEIVSGDIGLPENEVIKEEKQEEQDIEPDEEQWKDVGSYTLCGYMILREIVNRS